MYTCSKRRKDKKRKALDRENLIYMYKMESSMALCNQYLAAWASSKQHNRFDAHGKSSHDVKVFTSPPRIDSVFA